MASETMDSVTASLSRLRLLRLAGGRISVWPVMLSAGMDDMSEGMGI